MDFAEQYAIGKLQEHTYRHLQQIAKTMALPANVKKSCLINLIHTKIFGSQFQVEAIIQEVKLERQRCSQAKKKKPKPRRMGLQGDEISSTSGYPDRSPAIGATPKRSSFCGPIFVRYSPVLRRSLQKYTQSPTIVHQSSALSNAPMTRPSVVITRPNTNITRPNTTITRPNTTITRPNDATSRETASTSHPNVTDPLRTYQSPKVPCDRVLRNRRYPIYSKTDFKKPQTYREVLNSNDRAIEFIEKQNQERCKQGLKIVNRNEKGYLKNQTAYKVQNSSLLQKHKPSILSSSPLKSVPRKLTYKVQTSRNNEDIIVGVDRAQNASIEPQCLDLSPTVAPAKKQKRTISGIYPLTTPKVSTPQGRKTYEYVARGLGIRNRDGTYSKINALVQKPLSAATKKYTNSNASTDYVQNIQKESNFDFTVQDIIDSNIDSTAITFQEFPRVYVERYVDTNYVNTNYVNTSYANTYPVVQAVMTPTLNTYVDSLKDMSYVLDTPISMTSYQANGLESLNSSGLCEDFYTTYCHKKIRSEQVRTRRESILKLTSTRNEELPRIHEVFSSFNNVVQAVNVDSSQTLSYPVFNDRQASNTSMVEMLLNFKSQFLTHQPLSQITTRAVTRCVFSTPTVATAMICDASTNNNNNETSLASDLYMDNVTTYIPPAVTGATQDTDQNNSGSTTASLELLASHVEQMDSSPTGTMSDIEDALEWISQDGDYMERMGLDISMQCMLCDWAGPKYNLEHHITKEHQHRIHKFDTQEWNVTFSLSALLTTGVWHSEVIEGNHALYVLSAKAAQGTFRATLTTLSAETTTAKSGTVTVYNAVTGEPHSWSGLIPALPPTLLDESTVSSELSVKLDTLDVLPRSACDKVVYGPPNFGDIQITVFVKI